jgi:hypothetical protein
MTNLIHNSGLGCLAVESHGNGLEAVRTGEPSAELLKPGVRRWYSAERPPTYRSVQSDNLIIFMIKKSVNSQHIVDAHKVTGDVGFTARTPIYRVKSKDAKIEQMGIELTVRQHRKSSGWS